MAILSSIDETCYLGWVGDKIKTRTRIICKASNFVEERIHKRSSKNIIYLFIGMSDGLRSQEDGSQE